MMFLKVKLTLRKFAFLVGGKPCIQWIWVVPFIASKLLCCNTKPWVCWFSLCLKTDALHLNLLKQLHCVLWTVFRYRYAKTYPHCQHVISWVNKSWIFLHGWVLLHALNQVVHWSTAMLIGLSLNRRPLHKDDIMVHS